ncbi:MAG: phytanoyl-CoA dioxygenase family protein [Pseudomonadota bacterium]
MAALSERYARDGYVVIEDAIDAKAIASVRAAAAAIVDDFDIEQNKVVFTTTDGDRGRDEYFFDSAENVHCFLEEHTLDADGNLNTPKALAINKIGHALHDRDPVFNAFCRQPVIGELARSVGFAEPVIQQSMYIFKQPDIGGEVRWHQDASYLRVDEGAGMGMWIALEDATQKNGCLWMMPGEHTGPLRELYDVDWNERAGTLTTLNDEPWQRNGVEPVPCEVSAGSVVLFSDRIPHYSAANHSSASRHAMILHLIERDAQWASGNWLQRGTLAPFAI